MKCTATAKGTGEQCQRDAIAGGNVCVVHGGQAGQVKAAAKRRLAEDRARKRLDEVDVREIDNPIDEFRRVVSEVVSMKDLLATHVASLDGLEANAAEVRGVVGAYERALDRSAKFLRDWLSLGLEERRVTLEQSRLEEVLAGVAAAAEAVLGDRDLVDEFKRRLAEQLRFRLQDGPPPEPAPPLRPRFVREVPEPDVPSPVPVPSLLGVPAPPVVDVAEVAKVDGFVVDLGPGVDDGSELEESPVPPAPAESEPRVPAGARLLKPGAPLTGGLDLRNLTRRSDR